MTGKSQSGRVIGLDAHPETCTAAALSGPDAGSARVEWVDGEIAVEKLITWAKRRVRPEDVIVIEASGNTFELASRLQSAGCHVLVLESLRAGQIRKTYCNTDKISAVKLARVYLSGLAHIVWQPDEKTRARREIFHRYRRAVTDATRLRNRIRSWFSDHGIRMKKGLRLTQPSGQAWALGAHDWTPVQRLLIEQMFEELAQAHTHRKRLRKIMAVDVVEDTNLLQLVRLFGIRDITAFALGALIGDIHRFRTPKQLVAYIGLNPRVQLSGKGGYVGSLAHCGRRDLRSYMVEAAHAILRYDKKLGAWGRKLLFRKGPKVAVIAVARKLAVACWYLMHGRFTPLQEVDSTLRVKIQKLATVLGRDMLQQLGYKTSKDFQECLMLRLQTT